MTRWTSQVIASKSFFIAIGAQDGFHYRLFT
jgi:hypothetical protein